MMAVFKLPWVIRTLSVLSCLPLPFLYASFAYARQPQPVFALEFIQLLTYQQKEGAQPLLGISSIRYEPSDRTSSGKLVLLSDDTGAVENSYGQRDGPHLFEVNIDCSGTVGSPCHYSSDVARKSVVYPAPLLHAGLTQHQVDDNQFWCKVLSIGSYLSRSTPVCQSDLEGLMLLDNGEKLVMEEQVVGAKFSTPSVLRLGGAYHVIAKYSFPFKTFGFERRFSNRNTLTTGVRPNGGFEGIAAVSSKQGLYAAVTEFPLQQDSNRNRFILFALGDQAVEGGAVRTKEQYYYDVDPVTPDNPAQVKEGYPKTGVSDILAIESEQKQFMTVERTAIRYNDNQIKSVTKLFLVTLPEACQKPCSVGAPAQPVFKQEITIDNPLMNGVNIEGLAWGPKLSTGEQTLLLVNDNNARRAKQPTQLFVFKVIQKTEVG